MKQVPFDKLTPHLKNIVMNKWIKQYVARGLSLEDAQYAARWRSGTWRLNDRMKKVMAALDEVWYVSLKFIEKRRFPVDKQRQKYQGLLDMIDGGGAGAVGNEFEGGGLLSMIANAIATPYGSSDRMRDAMRGQRPVSRSAAMDSIETLSSQNLQNDLSPFGGVGPNISGPAAERGMGLGPLAVLGLIFLVLRLREGWA
jgi:hypothetical protein